MNNPEKNETIKEYHQDLIKSSDLYIKRFSESWWKNLDKENAKFISTLLNRITTVIGTITDKPGEKANPKLIENFPQEVLQKIEGWIDSEIPKDHKKNLDTLKLKIKGLKETKQAEAEIKSLVAETTTKPAKETRKSQDKEKLSNDKNYEKIEEKLELNTRKISDLIYLIENEKNKAENKNKIDQETSSKLLGELLSDHKKDNDESFKEIKSTIKNLEKYSEDLKHISNLIMEKNSERINIKETLQFLEIKNEIERYIASEIIIKVSKAIMPLIETMKDAPKESYSQSIKTLEEKCLAAGLLSVERIYG